ncbi:MAG: hypothetical protein EHM91_04310 [Planctomycetota bacterium]|nr:MAG: hypothetical protein EHM91_04310 [Planctomycetota bacterium]
MIMGLVLIAVFFAVAILAWRRSRDLTRLEERVRARGFKVIYREHRTSVRGRLFLATIGERAVYPIIVRKG